jgi:hypothetical protein
MASVKRKEAFINHHRTWLPIALIGGAFVILLGIASLPEAKERELPPVDQVAATQEMKSNYQRVLRDAFVAYDQTGSQTDLLNTLLTVRVPADYLNAHVNLVIAADTEDFSADALKTHIASMRAEFAWLQ